MKSLCLRSLRLYFRDKGSVFFSLLAVLIVFGLYALFLGDVYTDSLSDLGPGAGLLVSAWTMAGMVAVASVNTAMAGLGTMVQDRESGVLGDFLVTPVSRSRLLGGYAAAAFLIGVVMSLLTYVLAAGYLLTKGLEGAALFAPGRLGRVLLAILATSFSNTAMLLFLCCLFRSGRAYSAAGTVIGTLSGFLTGVYLPIGQLPEAVQVLIKLFPTSHGAALLRQEMMGAQLDAVFAGAPEALRQELEQILGVWYFLGGRALPQWGYWAYLLGTGILFFLLCLPLAGKKKR